MSSLLARGRALGKALVVAGCVPQGDRRIPELQDLSLLGARAACMHPASQTGAFSGMRRHSVAAACVQA